jgi:hypothetical protein
VLRPREHVDRLYRHNFIPAGDQYLYISPKCCRIAGDVDKLGRFQGKDGMKKGRDAAFSRRIEDDTGRGFQKG